MIDITASAPGKLILLGEYAVLEGAPAVVCAVQRRAVARVRPSRAWRLVAPAVLDAPLSFQWTDKGPEWAGPPPALPDHCLRCLAGVLGDLPPFELTLSTDAFVMRGRKLGIGSSAALAVAMVEALLAAAGHRLPDSDRLALALGGHRAFQGGRGSGADIAASATGGVVVYHAGPSPRIRTTELPAALVVVPVWTGRPASTTDMLARLDAWQSEHPSAAGNHLEALKSLAERGAAQLLAGDAEALVETARESAGALAAMARASGIPIVSPVHQRLRELAERHGLAYKPSGAGDGDFGVAFSLDPDHANAFAETLNREGFSRPLQPSDLAGPGPTAG